MLPQVLVTSSVVKKTKIPPSKSEDLLALFNLHESGSIPASKQKGALNGLYKMEGFCGQEEGGARKLLAKEKKELL